jgi:hypothetical protein
MMSTNNQALIYSWAIVEYNIEEYISQYMMETIKSQDIGLMACFMAKLKFSIAMEIFLSKFILN